MNEPGIAKDASTNERILSLAGWLLLIAVTGIWTFGWLCMSPACCSQSTTIDTISLAQTGFVARFWASNYRGGIRILVLGARSLPICKQDYSTRHRGSIYYSVFRLPPYFWRGFIRRGVLCECTFSGCKLVTFERLPGGRSHFCGGSLHVSKVHTHRRWSTGHLGIGESVVPWLESGYQRPTGAYISGKRLHAWSGGPGREGGGNLALSLSILSCRLYSRWVSCCGCCGPSNDGTQGDQIEETPSGAVAAAARCLLRNGQHMV